MWVPLVWTQSLQCVNMFFMLWSITAEKRNHHFSWIAVYISVRVAEDLKHLHTARLRVSQRISVGLRRGEYAGHTIYAQSSHSPGSRWWSQLYGYSHYHPLKRKEDQMLQRTILHWNTLFLFLYTNSLWGFKVHCGLGLHLDTCYPSHNPV